MSKSLREHHCSWSRCTARTVRNAENALHSTCPRTRFTFLALKGTLSRRSRWLEKKLSLGGQRQVSQKKSGIRTQESGVAGVAEYASKASIRRSGTGICPASENVFTESFRAEMRVSVPPHKRGQPRAKVRRGTLRK